MKLYSQDEAGALEESTILLEDAVKRHISDLKRSFLEIDPTFNSIVAQRGSRFVYAWDTGERAPLLEVGDIKIHEGMREIWWRGVKLEKLGTIEFGIVAQLSKKPNQTISVETLYNRAIAESRQRERLSGVELYRSMYVHIYRITAKFRLIDPDFNGIASTRGDGVLQFSGYSLQLN